MKELMHARNRKRLLNMIIQLCPCSSCYKKSTKYDTRNRISTRALGSCRYCDEKQNIHDACRTLCGFCSRASEREDLRETQALAEAAFNSDSDEDLGSNSEEEEEEED